MSEQRLARLKRERVGPIKPAAPALQALFAPEPGAAARAVSMQTHLVKRGLALPNAAEGLSGYAFDLPLPEPGRRLGWATLSTPWQFWEWQGWGGPVNTSSSSRRITGAADWLWFLTGNPSVFQFAPVFLVDHGHFTFETSIPPDGSGFDVGWLAGPQEDTYPNVQHSPNNATPLSSLLAMEWGGALKLWIALDISNPTLDGEPWNGPGSFDGGPDSLYLTYAYMDVRRPTVNT